MKYGESLFDLFYLSTTIIIGILILKKARNKVEIQMGAAVLILGCGDAFHLVPRVLNYFVDTDFTMALGIGKLITSITMTVFYLLMFQIGCSCFHAPKQKRMNAIVYGLVALRIILCLFPQNRWVENESSMRWGIIRNIPFVILGIMVMVLYYRHRHEINEFKNIWLWVLLSFAFYVPVAIFAGKMPILGMLMLPKTICYLLIVFAFYKACSRAGLTAAA